MMARTPSRINEVDDDLSTDVGRGVEVDVDMTGFLSLGSGLPFVCPGCVAAAFGPRGVEAMVTGEAAASHYCWAGPPAEGCENITPVTYASSQMPSTLGGQHHGAVSADQAGPEQDVPLCSFQLELGPVAAGRDCMQFWLSWP
jgi:hypothetical protein